VCQLLCWEVYSVNTTELDQKHAKVQHKIYREFDYTMVGSHGSDLLFHATVYSEEGILSALSAEPLTTIQ
jgi:hypothetical protein